ncbi:uncharacterized protein N7529_000403 [Penicillium soppii]|uniref:uncharacterized protein n=1 Tax=Penicillium soppii TaxID=69789 RepID=UPI0025468D5B|nr:uncharacterized protein N7529_000403 [Penicillium soppii]KAJ5881731.1 hypothetical protein N7529_000403 [Penicillium soppii]
MHQCVLELHHPAVLEHAKISAATLLTAALVEPSPAWDLILPVARVHAQIFPLVSAIADLATTV